MADRTDMDEARKNLVWALCDQTPNAPEQVAAIEALIDAKLRSLPAAPDGGKGEGKDVEDPYAEHVDCAECGQAIPVGERYGLPLLDRQWFHKRCARIFWTRKDPRKEPNAETKATTEAAHESSAQGHRESPGGVGREAPANDRRDSRGRKDHGEGPANPREVTPPPAPEPVCPTCGGKGWLMRDDPEVSQRAMGCGVCHGTGKRASSDAALQNPAASSSELAARQAGPLRASSEPSEDKMSRVVSGAPAVPRKHEVQVEPAFSTSEGKGERPSDEELRREFRGALPPLMQYEPAPWRLRAVADFAIQWERSRAAEQRAPEGEAVSLTADEAEALRTVFEAGSKQFFHHPEVRRNAQSALRKLNARAGVESAKKTEGEAKPDASEGDEAGARRMFEHARGVVQRDYPHLAVLPLQPRDLPLWENAYRFVRAESDGRIRELTAEVERWKRERDSMRDHELEMRDLMYETLHCDGHKDWLHDIIPRAHQVMRLLREAEQKTAEQGRHAVDLFDEIQRMKVSWAADSEKLHASESRIRELESEVWALRTGPKNVAKVP